MPLIFIAQITSNAPFTPKFTGFFPEDRRTPAGPVRRRGLTLIFHRTAPIDRASGRFIDTA